VTDSKFYRVARTQLLLQDVAAVQLLRVKVTCQSIPNPSVAIRRGVNECRQS
jgi:hypothetical protein